MQALEVDVSELLATVLVTRYETNYARVDNRYGLVAPSTVVKATRQSARSGKAKASHCEFIKANPWVSTSAKGEMAIRQNPDKRVEATAALGCNALPYHQTRRRQNPFWAYVCLRRTDVSTLPICACSTGGQIKRYPRQFSVVCPIPSACGA